MNNSDIKLKDMMLYLKSQIIKYQIIVDERKIVENENSLLIWHYNLGILNGLKKAQTILIIK
jgi:hypothetical protein